MAGRPRVRVSGPLASFVGGFSGELARSGYTSLSVRLQLQLMAHLSRWLASEELDAAALTPAVVERFVAARRAAGYANHRTAKGLEPLLGYLRAVGAVPLAAPAVAATPVEALLGRYRRYLLVERGLAEGTVRGYLDVVRPFLAERAGVDGLGLEPLTAAVPSVAGWRLAGLPRSLEPGQVRLLLASCDRRTAHGRRDFAILTLLARLGLRRGEVACLQLDQIDRRAGEIVIRGKGDWRER